MHVFSAQLLPHILGMTVMDSSNALYNTTPTKVAQAYIRSKLAVPHFGPEYLGGWGRHGGAFNRVMKGQATEAALQVTVCRLYSLQYDWVDAPGRLSHGIQCLIHLQTCSISQ